MKILTKKLLFIFKSIIILTIYVFITSNLLAKEDFDELKYNLYNAIKKCNINKIESLAADNTLSKLKSAGMTIERVHEKIYNKCSPRDFCKILPILIRKGVDINQRTGSGESLLHDVIIQSDKIVVKCLLLNGADPNNNVSNRTPIQLAKDLREREIYAILTEKDDEAISIQQLIEKDNLEKFKTKFRTGKKKLSIDQLLIAVSKNGALKIAKYLLEQGANLNYVGKYGYSAYFHAVSYADVPMLNLLMNHQLNINGQNSNNNGPIAWLFNSRQPVSLDSQTQITKLLIEKGLKPEVCKKGFKFYKLRYGAETREAAIMHDRHFGGSDYVYVYDILDSCKAP